MKKHLFFLFLFVLVLPSISIAGESSKKLTRNDCREHINKEEQSKGIEPGLLEAIAQIESKLFPLSVNAAGKAYNFKTIEEAATFIRTKQKEGYRNISVGPMQLHLPSHRRNFNSLEEMLDPHKNIIYAAKLLKRLKRQTGSTEKAVKLYHSPDSTANQAYKNRVFGAWSKIRKGRNDNTYKTPLTKARVPLIDSPKKTKNKKIPKISFTPGSIVHKNTY